MSADSLNWHCDWAVQKYDRDAVAYLTGRLGRTPVGADFAAAGIKPYEDNFIEGNLLTTAGLTRITSLILGAGGQAASQTAARIGTGNGAGTAVVGDTDLGAAAGSTNRQFVILDSAPSSSAGQMTFISTFTSLLGNYSWNEFGIDIGTPTVTNGTTVNATLLNHKTSIAQGTKTSGQSWTATATVTLS